MTKKAYFQLIGEIGFEKITLQNLTKKAVINCSTIFKGAPDEKPFPMLLKFWNM